MNRIDDSAEQSRAVAGFFDELGSTIDRMPAGARNARSEALETSA
jgi:hypothetical protein